MGSWMRARIVKARQRWAAIGTHVGDFQARLVLTLFYWCVAMPFAVVVRFVDPLRLRPPAASAWVSRGAPGNASVETARRQY